MEPTRELKEYFTIKYGRKAVEAYVLFSKKIGWSIVEKNKMYKNAKKAFKVSSINEKSREAFNDLFEALKDHFKIFRNCLKHSQREEIYEILYEHCNQYSINESISLVNLKEDEVKPICSCIRKLKKIKKLKSEKTPIMAISKFLHFYNPKLFPMYDTTYVNNRLLSIFRDNWKDFITRFNLSNCQKEDSEFKKYIQYIYWAHSVFDNIKNPNDIMEYFSKKIEQEIPKEEKKLDFTQYFALAFEFISLGACELKNCLYYESILSNMICKQVSK